MLTYLTLILGSNRDDRIKVEVVHVMESLRELVFHKLVHSFTLIVRILRKYKTRLLLLLLLLMVMLAVTLRLSWSCNVMSILILFVAVFILINFWVFYFTLFSLILFFIYFLSNALYHFLWPSSFPLLLLLFSVFFLLFFRTDHMHVKVVYNLVKMVFLLSRLNFSILLIVIKGSYINI